MKDANRFEDGKVGDPFPEYGKKLSFIKCCLSISFSILSFLSYFNCNYNLLPTENNKKKPQLWKTESCILCSLNVHCPYAHSRSLLQPQKRGTTEFPNLIRMPLLKKIMVKPAKQHPKILEFNARSKWKMVLESSECRIHFKDFDQDPLSELLWL